MYRHIRVPIEGEKIAVNADMSLNVPDHPIVPYIEGDGTDVDITLAMLMVVNAAVPKGWCSKPAQRSLAPESSRPKWCGATWPGRRRI